MPQVFRVSHADLYANPVRGVVVAVPVGTRQLRLMPTAAAVPVEVWTETQPPDARMQDGVLVHVPGETLYPGDSLLLRDGITTVTVRLPPAMNAGAAAYLAVLNTYSPFGEDGLRSAVYGQAPPAAGDLVDGPFGTNDGASSSIRDSVLVFSADRDVQLHAGVANATLPNTMRLPALYNSTGTQPNQTSRASVQGSLNGPAFTLCRLVSPWHLVPFGLLAKFRRVRLRIAVAQAWSPDAPTSHACALVSAIGAGSQSAWLVARSPFPMGAVRPLASTGRQYLADGSAEVTLDLGTPTDLFSIQATLVDTWVGYVTALGATPMPWPYQAKVAGEWIFDDGQSQPGHMESRAVLDLDVPAAATHGVFLPIPRGSYVETQIDAAGTAAEVRCWRVNNGAAVNITSTPDFSAPLAAGNNIITTLAPGDWYVAVYGGSGANVDGKLRVLEG